MKRNSLHSLFTLHQAEIQIMRTQFRFHFSVIILECDDVEIHDERYSQQKIKASQAFSWPLKRKICNTAKHVKKEIKNPIHSKQANAP